MNEGRDARPAFRQKSAEMAVAAFIFLLGAIVIYDSVRLGARWGDDGPQAGYFPSYIGLILCVASAVNLGLAVLNRRDRDRTFVEVGQLMLVLTVLIPSAIYVGLIGWTGIYVASAVYVALFMRWLGKYSWWKVAAVSIGNSVAFFLIFEIWFKVPLSKGPVEALLGLD